MFSECYIVFEKADIKSWWTKFLHKEISHCYLIEISGKNIIAYNKSISSSQIYTISNLGDIMSKSIVLKVDKLNSYGLFGLNTCVGIVKRYIGLSNPLIFTPYQLYKRLSNG
jgi:hypothetical protein